ncbi:MAG: hypothetical protein PUC05_02935 [Firmicutes bacterium]|nr:hypothetical protein [Bacillota bacterium]
MKKMLCLLAAIALLLLSGCDNINPEVEKTSREPSVSCSETPGSDRDFPEYINADALALRSYELCYLLAQKKFNSPEEMSVNALVQYCFCHLYYENLTDMPRSGNRLRQASVEEIKLEILKQFGTVDVDITQADLYNSGMQCFEMWEPLYGTDVFYEVSLSRTGENTYRVSSTFYSDSSQREIMGTTVLTVEDSAGQVLIKKLTSSK